MKAEHYIANYIFIGAPVKKVAGTQRIGNQLRATLMLQDINLLELIQHLTHERIPERLVHARGTGAHGYFEVTDSISDVTSADFLQRVGEKTPLFVRFSTVAGERGTAETVRDTRGFAFKMRTKEGILDWMFLSTVCSLPSSCCPGYVVLHRGPSINTFNSLSSLSVMVLSFHRSPTLRSATPDLAFQTIQVSYFESHFLLTSSYLRGI